MEQRLEPSYSRSRKRPYEMARRFDASLGPQGEAVVIDSQTAVDSVANGSAAIARRDGSFAVGFCQWAAYLGQIFCGDAPLPEGKRTFTGALSAISAGPSRERLAAFALGDDVAILLPEVEKVDLIRVATKKLESLVNRGSGAWSESSEPVGYDAPAVAADGDRALAAWRWRFQGDAIEGMWLEGGQKGAVRTLSERGHQVGAPARPPRGATESSRSPTAQSPPTRTSSPGSSGRSGPFPGDRPWRSTAPRRWRRR
jgi:hypothetical protein